MLLRPPIPRFPQDDAKGNLAHELYRCRVCRNFLRKDRTKNSCDASHIQSRQDFPERSPPHPLLKLTELRRQILRTINYRAWRFYIQPAARLNWRSVLSPVPWQTNAAPAYRKSEDRSCVSSGSRQAKTTPADLAGNGATSKTFNQSAEIATLHQLT